MPFVVVYTAISPRVPSAFGGEQKMIEFDQREDADALMERYNTAKNRTPHGVHTAVRIDGDFVLEAPVIYELTDISSVETTQVTTAEDEANAGDDDDAEKAPNKAGDESQAGTQS